MNRLIVSFLSFLLLCSPCWAGVEADGTDDYILINDNSYATVMTISIWIKWKEPVQANDRIFDWSDDTNNGIYFTHSGSPIDVVCGYQDTSSGFPKATYSNFQPTVGKWYLYTCVIEDTTNPRIRIYINGEEVATGNSSLYMINNGTDDSMQIGHSEIDSISTQYIENSIIGEFHFWNTNLTAAEIMQDYKAFKRRIPLQIQPANLWHYFTFDQKPEGADVKDYSYSNLGSKTSVTATPKQGGIARGEELLSY